MFKTAFGLIKSTWFWCVRPFALDIDNAINGISHSFSFTCSAVHWFIQYSILNCLVRALQVPRSDSPLKWNHGESCMGMPRTQSTTDTFINHNRTIALDCISIINRVITDLIPYNLLFALEAPPAQPYFYFLRFSLELLLLLSSLRGEFNNDKDHTSHAFARTWSRMQTAILWKNRKWRKSSVIAFSFANCMLLFNFT